MFDSRKHDEIKNDKILRRWIELAQFSYDIVYSTGKHNMVSFWRFIAHVLS